jgi:hypothetical protein
MVFRVNHGVGSARVVLAMTIIWAAGPVRADTINVPGDHDTLLAAINAAESGDEIILADGTYTGGGFVGLTVSGKSLTIRSQGGPHACIVDAALYAGGRILTVSSSAGGTSIRGITFSRGRAGGLYLSGNTTIENCRFIDNQLNDWGGAINYITCTVRIDHCTFIENYASIGGGAFSGYMGTSRIENCRFLQNSSTAGGAIQISESDARIVNSVFVENVVARNGGAIRSDDPDPAVINCTFLDNHAPWGGAAIFARRESQPLVSNCIIRGDEPIQVHTDEDAIVTLNHCDISGGWTGPGINNFDVDPCFIDPLGPDGQLGTEDDNLRLEGDSPCINAGSNNAVPGDVLTDLDGGDRIVDGIVDLGPYEFDGPDCPGDVDGDWDVDLIDLAILLASFELEPGEPYYDARADLNGDGAIDIQDLGILLAGFELPCP